MATIYGPYLFGAVNDADAQAWTFTTPNFTGLQPTGTAGGWCITTVGGASANTSTTFSYEGTTWLYTEASSPGATGDLQTMEFNTVLDFSAEQYQLTFWDSQVSPATLGENASDLTVEISENGGAWIEVMASKGDIQTPPANDITDWRFNDVDLSVGGTYTNANTTVRILITNNSATSWHGDHGIDYVTLTGTPLITGPVANIAITDGNDTMSVTADVQRAFVNVRMCGNNGTPLADGINVIAFDADTFGTPGEAYAGNAAIAGGDGEVTINLLKFTNVILVANMNDGNMPPMEAVITPSITPEVI